MQISSENYITILTEQIKALTIENMQLKALIMDKETEAKKTSDETVEKTTN
jgi:hypothetical protein